MYFFDTLTLFTVAFHNISAVTVYEAETNNVSLLCIFMYVFEIV